MAMDPYIVSELNKQNSPLHDKLLGALKLRLQQSAQRWGQRHNKWRENERTYRAFRDPDADDAEVASKPLTQGVQKIVVPYSYAQLQSMLAFLVTIFTDRKPIIPVEPVGDYMKAAIVHEHLLEYQMDRMQPRGVLVLIQWILDSLRYDAGIVKTVWTIREHPDIVRVIAPDGKGGTIDQLIEDDVVAYEGNESMNVSPFDFYPDPNRPLADFQKGEFVFHKMRRSPSEIAVKAAEGMYTGTQFIQRGANMNSDPFSRVANKSANAETVGMSGTDWNRGLIDEYDTGYVGIHEGWWFCRPHQLGLPTTRTRDLPTLWVFTIANENRIIRAEAANLPARRFPFSIMQANYDAHSPTTPAMIETTAGLQYHLSWLFNSRMAAVRKTLNNEMVLDPSVIEPVDWEDPNPSGIYRVTKDHYGTGAAQTAVFPVPVNDVTGNHLRDSGTVTELMDFISGASKNLQGQVNTGRRSASESQAAFQMASGRMKLMAAVMASQGMINNAEIMIANTQTFFGTRLNLPVNQGYQDILGGNLMTVTPELLQGVFRIPLLETGIPTDKAFHAATLKDIFTLWMQTPVGMGFAGSINGVEVYMQMLRLLGIKNVQDFVLMPGQQPMPQVSVQPDAQVQQQVAAGNLVPAQSSDGFPPGPQPQPGNNAPAG